MTLMVCRRGRITCQKDLHVLYWNKYGCKVHKCRHLKTLTVLWYVVYVVYLPHAEADTVLTLLLTLGKLKLLAGERLFIFSLSQVLASGLVRSAYTPGTARPHSRPQLTTPTCTILNSGHYCYLQLTLGNLSELNEKPVGIRAEGTHQRSPAIPSARVLANLTSGTEEWLVEAEPDESSLLNAGS